MDRWSAVLSHWVQTDGVSRALQLWRRSYFSADRTWECILFLQVLCVTVSSIYEILPTFSLENAILRNLIFTTQDLSFHHGHCSLTQSLNLVVLIPRPIVNILADFVSTIIPSGTLRLCDIIDFLSLPAPSQPGYRCEYLHSSSIRQHLVCNRVCYLAI